MAANTAGAACRFFKRGSVAACSIVFAFITSNDDSPSQLVTNPREKNSNHLWLTKLTLGQSARGLAHSMTLARLQYPLKPREASWSALALRRLTGTKHYYDAYFLIDSISVTRLVFTICMRLHPT